MFVHSTKSVEGFDQLLLCNACIGCDQILSVSATTHKDHHTYTEWRAACTKTGGFSQSSNCSDEDQREPCIVSEMKGMKPSPHTLVIVVHPYDLESLQRQGSGSVDSAALWHTHGMWHICPVNNPRFAALVR